MRPASLAPGYPACFTNQWGPFLSRAKKVAAQPLLGELEAMGAKYLPTAKDHKLTARYQQKQLTQSKFIKPANPAPKAPKAKKP